MWKCSPEQQGLAFSCVIILLRVTMRDILHYFVAEGKDDLLQKDVFCP
jgi:hypothetical protein